MQNLIDVLIIGGGPVGLACAIEAKQNGFSHLIIEKGVVVNSFLNWATNLTFLSSCDLLEIGGIPFAIGNDKPTRREGIIYYRKLKQKFDLNLHQYEAVLSVRRQDSGFAVISNKQEYSARTVIVATGFSDIVNKINVTGEALEKVSHIYKEPYPYTDMDVLIIGAKNSAAEAALELYRNGARVTLAVRKPELGKNVKYWLKPDLENRIKQGQITAYFNTVVEEIREEAVLLCDTLTGKRFAIKNDFVFALTGYRPDFEFLRSMGVGVTDDLHFTYNPETMETNVAGLYLAGVVAGGIDTGSLFIENGRFHAKQIITHLLTHVPPQVPSLTTSPSMTEMD